MSRVVLLVPDLMDRSRVEAAAAAAEPGVEVVRTRDPGEVAAEATGADVVVVDLSAPGALTVPRGLQGVRTVGFGSHVDRELLRAARDAGYDQVLARSAFFSGLPRLLTGLDAPGG